MLVAIDGSGHSKKALEFACDLANKYEAYMTILHVAYNAAQSHTMVLGASAMSYQANQKELDEMALVVMDAAREIANEAGYKKHLFQDQTRDSRRTDTDVLQRQQYRPGYPW